MAFNVNYHYYNGISIQIRRIFSKITPTANKFHRCNGNEIEKKKKRLFKRTMLEGEQLLLRFQFAVLLLNERKKNNNREIEIWLGVPLAVCTFPFQFVDYFIPHFHISTFCKLWMRPILTRNVLTPKNWNAEMEICFYRNICHFHYDYYIWSAWIRNWNRPYAYKLSQLLCACSFQKYLIGTSICPGVKSLKINNRVCIKFTITYKSRA